MKIKVTQNLSFFEARKSLKINLKLPLQLLFNRHKLKNLKQKQQKHILMKRILT